MPPAVSCRKLQNQTKVKNQDSCPSAAGGDFVCRPVRRCSHQHSSTVIGDEHKPRASPQQKKKRKKKESVHAVREWAEPHTISGMSGKGDRKSLNWRH